MKTETKITDKKLTARDTLTEVLGLFQKHNINHPRFFAWEKRKKGFFCVDWSDTKEVGEEFVFAGSGCIRYQLPSLKIARDIIEAVYAREPRVGDVVKIKNQSFGNKPRISADGVEAVVCHGDHAHPTERGLKLLIKRAEAREGFDPVWLGGLKRDLGKPVGQKTTALLARGYTCTIVRRPADTVTQIATEILGRVPKDALEESARDGIKLKINRAIKHHDGR